MGADLWQPAPVEDEGWKADAGDGEFAAENVSKHANGDFVGAADGGCRICSAASHFARDCPDKDDSYGGGTGECFRCGESGHMKADCTNPRIEREFTGECRSCGLTGHRAADCPSKPTEACKLCKVEGHVAADCTVSRIENVFKDLGVQEKSADEAWAAVIQADAEKDVDDIKKATMEYAKAFPEVTFQMIEQAFRDDKLNTFLIAKRQEIADTHTIVDLQGKHDLEFVVSFQFSENPRRAKFSEGWPDSREENMERLATAGFVMDSFVDKCGNCDQLGHKTRQCTEERVEREKIVITCLNCGEGHYVRDCPQPRKAQGKECRSCGEVGHISSDCPSKEPEICRNCQNEGHRAKDCDQERVMKCRNCDGLNHTARECDKPKDMSRVECKNCSAMGHFSRECPLCKAEPAEAADGGDGGWGDSGGNDAGGGGSGGDWGGDSGAAATGDTWGGGAAPAGGGDAW